MCQAYSSASFYTDCLGSFSFRLLSLTSSALDHLATAPPPPPVLLFFPFNVQMVLTVLQQEAVLEELGWARAAAELGLEGLGHGRPVVVLQVRQEKRVFRKRDLAQVALEQVLVLQ